MRIPATIVLAIAATSAWASKDGMYVAAGLSTNSYRGNDSDSFVRIVDDERATGFRLEIGHIWDLGKPGGFQLGVAGAFDRFGAVSNSKSGTSVDLEASALTAYFVIDQVLTEWLDFTFKVGPSGVSYQAEACCNALGGDIVDERKSRFGTSAVIGLVFFPTQNIGIELAAQATSWFTGDLRDIEDEDDFYDYLDTRVVARSLSASVQYRF